MKTYEFTDKYGNEYDLAFERTAYTMGDGLAIEVHCREKGYDWWEPYGTLTKNFLFNHGEDTAYVDDNNLHDLCEFVLEMGWARCVGSIHSGFCDYPLFRFSEKFLKEVAA